MLSLESLKDLSLTHVAYNYDTQDGTTILLKHNNTLYLGKQIED